MRSQVALLLLGMFLTKALTLNCNQCTPSSDGTCGPLTQTNICTQCATMTTTVITPYSSTNMNMKTCGTPDVCAIQSLNLGTVKVTNNAQCCSTDLCNSNTLPALQQTANGNMCYTCDANGCSKTVSCQGVEDRCLTATVQQAGNTISMKGCASQNVCAASGSSALQGVGVTSMSCCQGNLCNGAKTFTLSFLTMLVPLLSTVVFF